MKSGGGLGYVSDIELLTSLRRIIHDSELRDELADRGYDRRMGEWSEDRHLKRYLALIDQASVARSGRLPYRPALARLAGRASRTSADQVPD